MTYIHNGVSLPVEDWIHSPSLRYHADSAANGHHEVSRSARTTSKRIAAKEESIKQVELLSITPVMLEV
jgi:hypothetical protein